VPDFWLEPWLHWTLGIALGLPIALVLLTELHHWLTRTGSRMVTALPMLRTFVVPCLALLLLLTKGAGIQFQVTGVRMVATVFALLVLLLVLSSLNVAVFGQARAGSWRDRVPSIFIEIARVLIVGIGLAILLSQVWGADVGGLFTALGVTSLVVGLALQNAAGSIVSGLLLLFEQPFKLGDYLQTSTGKVPGVEGRVVEVNWRAVHIDTGGAICIVPNALLADSAFLNLSRPSTAVSETVATKFGNDDSPGQVCALLERLAADLPGCPVGTRPVASVKGGGAYEVVLRLQDLTDIAGSRSLFLGWLWYASRREGLHLDGAGPGGWTTAEATEQAARSVCAALFLSPDEAAEMAADLELVRYGTGETVQSVGERPDTLGIVVTGRIGLSRVSPTGDRTPVGVVDRSGYVHPSALTREAITLAGTALEETSVLNLSVEAVHDLVRRRPRLASDLGDEIDRRRELAECPTTEGPRGARQSSQGASSPSLA
jgi:small-conductance mechanosensitive channel